MQRARVSIIVSSRAENEPTALRRRRRSRPMRLRSRDAGAAGGVAPPHPLSRSKAGACVTSGDVRGRGQAAGGTSQRQARGPPGPSPRGTGGCGSRGDSAKRVAPTSTRARASAGRRSARPAPRGKPNVKQTRWRTRRVPGPRLSTETTRPPRVSAKPPGGPGCAP